MTMPLGICRSRRSVVRSTMRVRMCSGNRPSITTAGMSMIATSDRLAGGLFGGRSAYRRGGSIQASRTGPMLEPSLNRPCAPGPLAGRPRRQRLRAPSIEAWQEWLAGFRGLHHYRPHGARIA